MDRDGSYDMIICVVMWRRRWSCSRRASGRCWTSDRRRSGGVLWCFNVLGKLQQGGHL